MAKYQIRIDDYPHKPSVPISWVHKNVKEIFKILGKYDDLGIIWGITPFALSEIDIELLSTAPPCIKYCMHGFTHLYDAPMTMWENICQYWPNGAEYAGCTVEQISVKYDKAKKILDNIPNVDYYSFIAPFNVLTQELIDVLHDKGIKEIYSEKGIFEKYQYCKYNFHGIKPILSQLYIDYDFAVKLLANSSKWNPETPITLHWAFDCTTQKWEENYIKLFDEVRNRK